MHHLIVDQNSKCPVLPQEARTSYLTLNYWILIVLAQINKRLITILSQYTHTHSKKNDLKRFP
jgi:hypothetical protein